MRKSIIQIEEVNQEVNNADTNVMILDIIKSIVNNPEKTDITLNTELSALQVNSIDFIRIVIAIEDQFSIQFEDEMLLFSEFPTIKSLVNYVDIIQQMNSGNCD